MLSKRMFILVLAVTVIVILLLSSSASASVSASVEASAVKSHESISPLSTPPSSPSSSPSPQADPTTSLESTPVPSVPVNLLFSSQYVTDLIDDDSDDSDDPVGNWSDDYDDVIVRKWLDAEVHNNNIYIFRGTILIYK